MRPVTKAKMTKKKSKSNVAPEIAIPSPNAAVMKLSSVLARSILLVAAATTMTILKRKPTIIIAKLWSEHIREKDTRVQLRIGALWMSLQVLSVSDLTVLVVGVKRLPGSAIMVLADPSS